jgi:hypothetical protein
MLLSNLDEGKIESRVYFYMRIMVSYCPALIKEKKNKEEENQPIPVFVFPNVVYVH